MHLEEVRFFDLFGYSEEAGAWQCFMCNNPEKATGKGPVFVVGAGVAEGEDGAAKLTDNAAMGAEVGEKECKLSSTAQAASVLTGILR